MLSGHEIQSISASNLSLAWAKAFVKCYEEPGGTLYPGIVRFPATNIDGLEVAEIRQLIDKELIDPNKYIQSPIETVAGTIFPESLWKLSKGERHHFFETYRKSLPIILKCKANRNGVYFQRLVAFKGNDEEPINQLEHIINTWHSGNHRHSALQAAIFDPRKDHSNAPRQGFPCLQQIAFHPVGANGKDGLSVVAFYANQTMKEKAYGNYLGLYRLGLFMAKEMGIKLKEVVCIASALKMSNGSSKSCCEELANKLKVELKNAG